MPRTYQCYDCGCTVPDTEVTRRNITTYGSSGRYIRTNSRRVNLCADCFDDRDVSDRRNTRIAIAIAVLVVVALYVWLAQQPRSPLWWPRF